MATCKECKFADGLDSYDSGYCRRFPPIPVYQRVEWQYGEPVMGVLSDANSLIRAIKNEFSEDNRKSGKSLAKLAKMVPPFGQAVRVVQYGDKIIAQQ